MPDETESAKRVSDKPVDNHVIIRKQINKDKTGCFTKNKTNTGVSPEMTIVLKITRKSTKPYERSSDIRKLCQTQL